MEIIETHLFHGFLGCPEDWKSFKEKILLELEGRGVHCRFHCHNLWEDFRNIVKTAPHGHKNYFEVWADRKIQELNESEKKKFLLGYSLGGRLLMHLRPQKFENIQGLALMAAHPGILDPAKRKQRLLDDCFWGERFIDEPWDKLMDDWNGQSVFSNDKNRPVRAEKNYDRKLLSRYFKEWSLGVQVPRDKNLKKSEVPFYWLCGEKDFRYASVLERMRKLLGPQYCFTVDRAGHGCHWDNPQRCAQIIAPLIMAREGR